MASAELFNLTQPNQKQFSDNNTMELSLTELKMKFDGLDGLTGLSAGGDSAGNSSCGSSNNGDITTTTTAAAATTDACNSAAVSISNGGGGAVEAATTAAAAVAATSMNKVPTTTTTTMMMMTALSSCSNNANGRNDLDETAAAVAAAASHSMDRNEALAAEMVASALSMETAFDAMFPAMGLGSNRSSGNSSSSGNNDNDNNSSGGGSNISSSSSSSNHIGESLQMLLAMQSANARSDDGSATHAVQSKNLMGGSSDESGLEMDASGGSSSTNKETDDNEEAADAGESALAQRSPLSMLSRLSDGGFGGGALAGAKAGSGDHLLLLSGLGDDEEHNSATSGSSRSGSIGLGSSLLSGASGSNAASGNELGALGLGGASSGNGARDLGGVDLDSLMGGALEGDSHSLGSGGGGGGDGSGNGFGADGEQECKICKSALEMPRVLACLHVVCEGCLETLLLDETGDTINCSIACPVCKQMTTIDSRGAAGLHLDYTITNTVDLNTVEPQALACTSCKSKEQAMSRCNDCANFLCASCDNAHKYMRCFESHTVVLLADLRSSVEPVVIHKPLFCALHTSELLKYYCFSCQTVACSECLVAVHKGAEHQCDLIAEAEPRVRADLEVVVAGARAQIAYCDSAAGQLSNTLTELQQQHDGAAERIERTYERCVLVLQRCREHARADLQRLHAERELHVMDAMHGVETSVERIETTCRFARKVLHRGNGAELLSLQPLITRQVHAVVAAMPQVDGMRELCFEGAGVERFEALAQEAFGGFGGGSGGGSGQQQQPHQPQKQQSQHQLLQQHKDASKLMMMSERAARHSAAAHAHHAGGDMSAAMSAGGGAANDCKESTPPPTLPGVLPMLAKANGIGLMGSSSISGISAQSTMTSGGASHSASSPISMPTSSMQSSFDGDLLGNSFLLANGSGAASANGGLSSDDSQQQQQLQQQLLHQNMNHLQNQQQQHQQHVSNVDLLKREQQHQQQQQQQLNCNTMLSGASVHSPLGGNGANTLASVLANVAANNALAGANNSVVNGLASALNGVVAGGNLSNALNGIGSVGSALVNGLNAGSAGPVSIPSANPLSNMAGLTSIAEYNLHRLANLVESGATLTNEHLHQQQQQQHISQQQQQNHHHHHLQQQQQQQHLQQQHHHNMSDDTTIATLNGNNGNNGAVNNNLGGGTAFTLSDLINGDQRAFNQNLHALAKLNMNGGVGNALSGMVGSGNRGPSPSIGGGNGSNGGGGGLCSDNGSSLLNDFIGMPGNTSPIGTISSSIGDGDLAGGSGSASALSNLTAAMNLAGRTKATPMQIRCKFGSLGASKAQFNSPHGFCLGVEEEIIVADTNNHRIQVFEKIGTFKFQFGVPGKEEGQLWYPRKVAVMRTSGKFVVCDRGNERSRMQIFTKNGHFIKKIAIRYIDIVAGLAVTNQGHIVAVDSVSPTVFIIAEDGNLVHWFDCSDYMREPSDIAISGTDFYVCDFKGHNVAVFSENGTFMHRIGDEKITCFPNGIDISDAGDILIGDSHGNRFHVACFSRDGVLQSEFECPYVKVSRCCGLKITSEGYVVTLAKNNHHVLVLNTLYIH